MKISIPKIFTKHVQQLNQVFPKIVTEPDIKPVSDRFKLNIEKALNFDSNGNLSFVNYYPSTILSAVIMDILHDKMLLKELSKIKINPKLELQKLEQEIFKSKEIGETKIKSFIGYGYRALVFETESGKVIKITKGDHFNGRQSADFDLPVEKRGKLIPDGEFHYYIEDKVSQEELSQKELLLLTNHIKKSGYKLRDYKVDSLPFGRINIEQFGRASDGKIYLIDPECADKINSKESLFDKICRVIYR